MSTIDRDSEISWADPAPNSAPGGGWGSGESGSWVDSEESPDSGTLGGSSGESWGGGNWSGGKDASSESGWGSAPTPPPAAPASSSESSGWLGGDSSDSGWGGGTPAAPASSAPAPQAQSGGGGWLGEPAPAPSNGLGGSVQEASNSGWLGGGEDSAPAGPSGGSGWLGDSAGSGYGDSGGGWLGGDGPPSSVPTMTQMVDQAIHDESEDDFVDDSWVDEEIRDSEFDELEVPEIVPPAPEVGGVVLKMVLVAALVLLVGGGVFFMKKDSKTPEQVEAERLERRAAFAQAAIEGGKEDLANNRAQLAVPQFQEAMVALSEVGATQKEVDQVEVLLSKSLMGSEEYEPAIEHWRSLKGSEDPEVQKAAEEGLQQAARQLRIQANDSLKEAKKYADKGEYTTVLRTGKDALELYEEYGGSATQKGDAHGVIGRSYINGRNYGAARDHLKKAVALAPGLGYQKYLNQVNAELTPRYTRPVNRVSRPAVVRPASKPSFNLKSPSYRTNSRRVTRRNRGGGSTSSGGGSTTSAPKPRMKEIPIYQSKSRPSNSTRKGSKGVLNSY